MFPIDELRRIPTIFTLFFLLSSLEPFIPNLVPSRLTKFKRQLFCIHKEFKTKCLSHFVNRKIKWFDSNLLKYSQANNLLIL